MFELKKYQNVLNLNDNDLKICNSMEESLKLLNKDNCISDLIGEVSRKLVEKDEKSLFDMAYTLYKNNFCYKAVEYKDISCILEILQEAHYLYNENVIFENIYSIINNFILKHLTDTDDILSEIMNVCEDCSEDKLAQAFDVELICIYNNNSIEEFLSKYKNNNITRLIERILCYYVDSEYDYIEPDVYVGIFYDCKDKEKNITFFDMLKEAAFNSRKEFFNTLEYIISTEEFKIELDEINAGYLA